MTVKEVLENVCVFLGKDELLASSYFTENGSAPTTLQTNEINKMLKCYNNIISEISSDYIPLVKQKEVSFNNGKIGVSDIDENIQEIISIKTTLGKNLKYKYVNNQVVCLTNCAIIEYKVYPDTAEFSDNAETFCNRLSARVLAYGVASEFCYLEMLYDDATIWETRFKNSLLFACRKKGEIKLKQRGWF